MSCLVLRKHPWNDVRQGTDVPINAALAKEGHEQRQSQCAPPGATDIFGGPLLARRGPGALRARRRAVHAGSARTNLLVLDRVSRELQRLHLWDVHLAQ